MKTKKRLFYWLGAGLIVLSAFFAVAVPNHFFRPQNCYALLSPVAPDSGESSQILESGCYDTFTESIAAATGGRVHLDPSITGQDLTDEMLNH